MQTLKQRLIKTLLRNQFKVTYIIQQYVLQLYIYESVIFSLFSFKNLWIVLIAIRIELKQIVKVKLLTMYHGEIRNATLRLRKIVKIVTDKQARGHQNLFGKVVSALFPPSKLKL